MDSEYEERVLSILRGVEGCDDKYSSVSEFKQDLDEEAALAHEKLEMGWVLWRENEREQQHQYQMVTLLKYISSSSEFWGHYIVQFWAVVQVEGRYRHLSSSHHPFCVGELRRGLCWYRKLCKGHVYVVDVEAGADEEEQLGGVGRVYRNKHPESTPDLRLYSTNEYPMRDDAARCGFRAYLALPIFDFHTNQYYGVLELLSHYSTTRTDLLSALDGALQIAGLRSTHQSISIWSFTKKMKHVSEITKILELAMEAVPRLYLAQVWVPCKECTANMTTNLCCMEMASFINSENSWCVDIDYDMCDYLEACGFHNLQIDLRSFDSNLCDLSISKNPLAHYAKRARISHCFAIYLQSVNNSNHLYVLEFFLQPRFREHPYGDYSVHLLLRIIEMNLKSFKFVSGGQLHEEFLQVQSRHTNAIECESISSLDGMNFLELNFTTYLEAVDSFGLQPSSEGSGAGWNFCWPTGERSCQNNINSNPLLVPTPIKERIENFMKRAVNLWTSYCIVQFWAPKMVKDRCYLETLDQPYAVGCLSKGIAYFRKKCTMHYYFADKEAKEEELGPPGRVFRNGHPEITPDIFHYTTKEFSIRNYAMHYFSRGYIALPIFDDQHNHKCVGVLEFVGFVYSDLEDIGRELEAAKLCSTHTDFHPRFLANERPANTFDCRREALTEVCNGLEIMCNNIPQLYMANVWVPNAECVGTINSSMSCMELAFSTNVLGEFMPTDEVHWIHVQTRKGMVGMVLASESKSCFCQKLCEFSIADQPLSHFEMSKRCDVCFAICLQSSHTGELLYVVELFLYPASPTYEYVRSFLHFLLPMMKHELKSFKMACGKQLGEELVVEVIEFSEANRLGSSESEQADLFPIKFKSVQYSQKEHQNTEEQQTEECSTVVVSDSKTREKGKGKSRLHLSPQVLKPHFGKNLKDVAEELGIGRSTIKRACREYGIPRWPNREEHIKNLTLFERESGRDSQQDTPPSTSNLQPLDTPLHQIVTHTNTEIAENVIIKVKYEEDIIKFELCLSLGLAKLTEEVATSLNLGMGSFKLKYLDEDDDEILLTRDDDLQLCPKSRTATGKTCIKLLVR